MARRQRSDRPVSDEDVGTARVIRRGESRIAYQIQGDGGATVLLLQPFWVAADDVADDSATFGPHLSAGHRVIVHDRRGTGDSDRRPGLIDVHAQVEDLTAILDDAGARQVLVVAMTEAAPLAVHFAAAQPERVRRLALIDPQLKPRIGPGSAMLLQTLHSRPRVGLRAFARSLAGDEGAEELAGRMMERMDAPTAARLFEAFLQADALSVTGAVACRVMLAFGVHETLAVEEEARELLTHFPDAQLGMVAGDPGSPAAAREAWVQLRDFLGAATPPGDEDELGPAPRAAATAPLSLPRTDTSEIDDYVPAGRPAAARPLPAPGPVRAANPAALSPRVAGPPPPGQWSLPGVPREAIELNRLAIDRILIGDIEAALAHFQRAMEIAPTYEDAAINYRELLSRLVQRRVEDWQNTQAETCHAEAGKRGRYTKRSRRLGLSLLHRNQSRAA
jgi:pimeloyl-ACP methyl ester carboxylesterase